MKLNGGKKFSEIEFDGKLGFFVWLPPSGWEDSSAAIDVIQFEKSRLSAKQNAARLGIDQKEMMLVWASDFEGPCGAPKDVRQVGSWEQVDWWYVSGWINSQIEAAALPKSRVQGKTRHPEKRSNPQLRR